LKAGIKLFLIYLAATALLGLTWVGGMAVDHKLERVAPEKAAETQRYGAVFKGRALKVMSLGYDHAVATYYWLKLIQYCAYADDNSLPMENLYTLFEIITDLDPHYRFAYELAWINLMYYDVRPMEIRKREGLSILRKGFHADPEDWRIVQDLAFHLFYYEKKYEKAAKLYHWAYRLRKFPLYARLATRLETYARGPEAALIGLEIQLKSVGDEKVKKELRRQIKRVRAEKTAQELDKYIEKYVREVGRCPDSLQDMVREGFIRFVPADGLGGTYELDKEKCRVESTTIGRLEVYLPEETGGRAN